MKIFVVGGAGYIGSICVEEVLNAGHQVTVFDNLSEGHRSAVDPRAAFVQGDLANYAEISAALKAAVPEAVMHFAAASVVPESMVNPSKYFHNNVANAIHLLDAIVEHGIKKFVFSGTCAIFGTPERVPMTEDLPVRPLSPYGQSKAMVEQMLRWYDQIHGVQYVSLRYFNAAGASEKFGEHHRRETHLIPNVLAVALGTKDHVEIYGTDYLTPDGTCVRDYIHIIDLAQAHILALQCRQSACFNLGCGDGYTVKQVIDTCRKVTGHPIHAIERPRRPGDPPKLVASSKKISSELGWKPRFNKLQDIVASAWAWHKTHLNGYPD
ncbi:MAG: UDP-glucose 4-epimerase GalE [Verrucomicrobia bacterium]|nr:UDP-glucose 4-epimerase GalE [Verrucomicrobiota bacterium]